MKQELNDQELQKTAGGVGGANHPSLKSLKESVVIKHCPQCGDVTVKEEMETCPKCGSPLTEQA